MALQLSGVAFITGAGGSIGSACVLQFARDGVTRIAGLDISEHCLESTAAKLATYFPNVEFLKLIADPSSKDQVEKAITKTVTTFGRLDYAVNKAAVGSPFKATHESATADFERVLGNNLRGTWFCERAELRQMLGQEALIVPGSPPGKGSSHGSIIMIDSLLGVRAVPENRLYTISKQAAIGLARTDAIDYAESGIRINAVCLGFVDTPLVTPAIRELLDPSIRKTPMGRLAHPQKIADMVTFLASDRASYITGTTMLVDGGLMRDDLPWLGRTVGGGSGSVDLQAIGEKP